MNRNNPSDIARHERQVYERFEWAHIVVIGVGSFLFLIGSVFFLYERLMIVGTWLFIVGSALFVAANLLRVADKLVNRKHVKRPLHW